VRVLADTMTRSLRQSEFSGCSIGRASLSKEPPQDHQLTGEEQRPKDRFVVTGQIFRQVDIEIGRNAALLRPPITF